jgi:hypothetical protein
MPENLTFGLFSLNTGACSYPATAIRIAQAAAKIWPKIAAV